MTLACSRCTGSAMSLEPGETSFRMSTLRWVLSRGWPAWPPTLARPSLRSLAPPAGWPMLSRNTTRRHCVLGRGLGTSVRAEAGHLEAADVSLQAAINDPRSAEPRAQMIGPPARMDCCRAISPRRSQVPWREIQGRGGSPLQISRISSCSGAIDIVAEALDEIWAAQVSRCSDIHECRCELFVSDTDDAATGLLCLTQMTQRRS